MLKIAVCDDNQEELSHIPALLEAYQKERGTSLSYKPFLSSVELASTAQSGGYSLYLLDAIMPALDGIGLAKEIRSFDKAASIIFLTSSPEFAVESYTVKAANYLIKPIDKAAFFAALDDILSQHANVLEKSIIVKSELGVRKVPLSSLLYVEARGRSVIYCLQNGEQLTCISRFATVCSELLKNPEFIQTHRSYLVNMNHISSINAEGIELQNQKLVPLAQRRLAEIREHYLAFQMEEVQL